MSTLSVCLVGSALLLSGRASAQLVFEPQVVGYSTTGTFWPRLDLGDVDGDGDIDTVFSTDTDSFFHDYEVMLNDGSGKLVSASSLSVTPGIWSLKLLPFDADPNLDLLTAQANSIFLRRGLGNGSFAAPELIYSGGHPNIGRIEALDMTGDGVPDLVVLQGGKITLLPATGHGGVGAPIAVGDVAPQTAYAARAADLDGNGQVDLVVSARDESVPSHPASIIHVYLGRGSGDFIEWASYFVGDLADVELMTLAGDSALDLVCSSVSGVEVWTGLGTGGFQFATQLESGSYGTGLAVADYDDDGLLDVASVSKATREVVFWRQDDQGALHENLRLSHADPYPIDGEPPLYTRPMMAADMDGDGKVDLVRTVNDEFSQVQVSVFRNHTYGRDEPFLDLGLSVTDPGISAPLAFEYPGMLLATPILLLDGTMQSGTPVRFRVFRHGVEPEVAWLLLGYSPLMAPAFGGTMVPTPNIVIGPLVLPGFDSVADVSTNMPEGVPPGMQFWLQAWFPPGETFQKHYSATSGVRLTAP